MRSYNIRTLACLFLTVAALADPSAAQDTVKWSALGDAQQRALAEDRTVFVFVEAAWCGICKRMKRDVFPRPDISRLLEERYVAVSIDLDSQKAVTFNGQRLTERAFARTMNVQETPTLIFLGPDGRVLGTYAGYVAPDRFHALLRYVVLDAFGDVPFDVFAEDAYRR